MFTVIITEKGGDQRRMDFDKPEVTIGRVQGNDIILPKGNVSKRHSRIVLKDGKFIIVDLKSTNGTYVNGRKITSPLVIKDSDKVYIGDFIISVEEGAGAGASAGAPYAQPVGVGPYLGAEPPMPPPPTMAAMGEPSHLGGPSGGAMSPPMPPPPVRKSMPPSPPPPAPRRPIEEDDDEEPEELIDDSLEAEPIKPPPPVAPPPEQRPTLPRPAMNPPPGLVGVGAVPPPAPPPLAPVRAAPPVPSTRPPGDPLAARAAAVGASREAAAPAAPAPNVGTVPARPDGPRLVGAGAPRAAQPPAPFAPLPGPPPAAPPPLAAVPAPTPLPVSSAAVTSALPPPDPNRAKVLELQREIHDRLVAQLDLTRIPIERLGDENLWQRAESAIVDIVEQFESDGQLPAFVDQDTLIKDALNEALGLGPLEDLLADDEVTDVLVNRPDRVIVSKGGRLMPYEKAFSSDAALRRVIDRLIAPSGRRAGDDAPLIDLRLRDGARLTAAIAPLAVRGACLTLRKPRRQQLSLDDLTRAGTLSTNMAGFLSTCVSARRNIVICGGAGAGKTTLAAALAGLFPPGERIVTVEDVAELALGGDQWIALETRPPDADGKGGVGLADVLRAAIRMRPDRLVVGDVRGAEAFPLISAMSSAHEGTVVCVAGEGVGAALSRLETLSRLAAPEASVRGLRELVTQAAHIVVCLARYGDGSRRIASVAEVAGVEGEGWATRELFHFQVQGQGEDGRVRGRFAGAGVVARFYETLEARGVHADPAVFR